MRVLTAITLTTALVLVPAFAAGAQQERVLTPVPLAEDAPTAQRARAVATLVLAGDPTKLEAYLKEHAAPSFSGSDAFASDIARVIESAKTGARTIVRLDGLGEAGVGVALGQREGAEPERAIVVSLEPQPPHRVTGLRIAQIRMGGGE